MAPKQATLGYVRSGQATLGWVVIEDPPPRPFTIIIIEGWGEMEG